MTQQFKFGDRVRYKSPESKLRGFVASTRNRGQNKIIVAFEGEDWLHHCSSENLELIPHPDTERIDWLVAQDDIDITLGGVINLKQPDLRTAIDIAMQACIAAVAIKFTAHFEEMVARGEAERLPDGRYQIFEKAT